MREGEAESVRDAPRERRAPGRFWCAFGALLGRFWSAQAERRENRERLESGRMKRALR